MAVLTETGVMRASSIELATPIAMLERWMDIATRSSVQANFTSHFET
jgi:hypothetical protein